MKFAHRDTFLISPAGKIVKVLDRSESQHHSDDVLAAIAGMNGNDKVKRPSSQKSNRQADAKRPGPLERSPGLFACLVRLRVNYFFFPFFAAFFTAFFAGAFLTAFLTAFFAAFLVAKVVPLVFEFFS